MVGNDPKVPHATCEVELPTPLLSQLKRDMQHWAPLSITPALLDAARQKPDGPVRAAVMIVNRTVYWQRPIGTPRSPVLVTLLLDLQELADTHVVPDVELVVRRHCDATAMPLRCHCDAAPTHCCVAATAQRR